MESWEELHNLIRRLEESLLRMEMRAKSGGPEVFEVYASGCYSRSYLVERLPAETARSDRSGRPFGLGMIRLKEAAFGNERDRAWQRTLERRLDPIDVPVRFDDRTLLLICPEQGSGATRARLEQIGTDLVIEGLGRRRDMRLAAVAYPELDLSPDRLLEALEERLQVHTPVGPVVPVGQHEAPDEELAGTPAQEESGIKEGGTPDSEEVPGPVGAPDPGKIPGAVDAPDSEEVPVAVGFAADRKLPSSFWYEDELYVIHALLSDTGRRGSTRTLAVKTSEGEFRLTERKGRWYAVRLGDRRDDGLPEEAGEPGTAGQRDDRHPEPPLTP